MSASFRRILVLFICLIHLFWYQEPWDQSDLDRFDPQNKEEEETDQAEYDYSSLSVEELDKLIDSDYSQEISPQCQAAVIGMFISPFSCLSSFFILHFLLLSVLLLLFTFDFTRFEN